MPPGSPSPAILVEAGGFDMAFAGQFWLEARFYAGLLCLFLVLTCSLLVAAATLFAMLPGWSSVVVTSDSMSPSIERGDIVLLRDHDGTGIPTGSVIVYDDPVQDGLVTHRILDQLDDGSYATKGDANGRRDSDPVAPSAVHGVGTMLIPLVGLPSVWLGDGAYAHLTALAAVTLLALWASSWALLGRFGPLKPSGATAPDRTSDRATIERRLKDQRSSLELRLKGQRSSPRRPRRLPQIAAALIPLILLLTFAVSDGTLIGDARAIMTASTGNAANVLAADTLNPPTGLQATVQCGSPITVSWTSTVDTYASGHRILRGTTAGGPYSQVAEVTPRTTATYGDSPADGTYYYVVRAFHENWESLDSSEVSATTPAGTDCDLNLQANDTEMSTATSPTRNIDTNDGATDYFTATSPIKSASNDTDWTLLLVLRDKPDTAAPATVTVWWQNGGACSGGPVSGQIFATASVTVPIAVDKQGVSLTVTKAAGTVSHTFLPGDELCMSLANDGTAGSQSIHFYANTGSTSGSGVSRLSGSFIPDTLEPPTNVTASAGTGPGTIDLSWTVTGDAFVSGYRVLRSATAGGPYTQISEVTAADGQQLPGHGNHLWDDVLLCVTKLHERRRRERGQQRDKWCSAGEHGLRAEPSG